jgi:hypothetical protein
MLLMLLLFYFRALTMGPCFLKHLLLDEFPIEPKLVVMV